jgi:hypothetical protein
MRLKEPVIYSAVQNDNICRILPDDEICRAIDREISSMERPLKSMVLTWKKVRREYRLEIILTEEVVEGLAVPETRCVTVGCVGEREYDARNKLVVAGRRLYFRLRKDFPMLQRKLNTYKYLRAKMRCLYD